MTVLTLIQAQQRYIDRTSCCHVGHFNRVERSAAKQLLAWAKKRGLDGRAVLKDAKDMALLIKLSDD